jgi:hypothetical protein
VRPHPIIPLFWNQSPQLHLFPVFLLRLLLLLIIL